jgi:hypothetical protein
MHLSEAIAFIVSHISTSKTVIILEREIRTAATDDIVPLRYQLMYPERKHTELTSLVSDRNGKRVP